MLVIGINSWLDRSWLLVKLASGLFLIKAGFDWFCNEDVGGGKGINPHPDPLPIMGEGVAFLVE
jgi:hypothetical protein